MKKRIWILIMSLLTLLFVFQILFVFWSKSNLENKTNQLNAYQKALTGSKVVSKHFVLNSSDYKIDKTKNIEKPPAQLFPSLSNTVKEEKDGWHVVNDENSLLVLVNKTRKLPDNFIPIQLIEPNVRYSFSGADEKKKMRAVAGLALEELFDTAEKEGHILYAVSGYRSFERQIQVHERHVNELGEKKAKELSAYPGSSEHQTGLAMDISSMSANFDLTEKFGNTQEGRWVKENAHLFGFIIRYPKDKTETTGYSYEPWHLRYVGKEAATYLYDNNLTLEEAIK